MSGNSDLHDGESSRIVQGASSFSNIFSDDSLVNRTPEIQHDCLNIIAIEDNSWDAVPSPRLRCKTFPRLKMAKALPKKTATEIINGIRTGSEPLRSSSEKIFGAKNRQDLWDHISQKTPSPIKTFFGELSFFPTSPTIHKQHEAAREATYPQYGGTGPAIEKKAKKSPTASGDANLAYSAQLHHFNQTKQKIISTETSQCDTRGQESDDSEGEGEEGDYSVYECPGLAPTGDIEVSNPLFENASPKNKDAPESISKATDGD